VSGNETPSGKEPLVIFGYLLELRLESFFFLENSTTKKTPQIVFAKLEKKVNFEIFHHKKKKTLSNIKIYKSPLQLYQIEILIF